MIEALIIIIGFFGLITNRDLIRKIMCINIIQGMLIYMFINFSAHSSMTPPILNSGDISGMADPVPHALMLTAIVVGVCFNSIALSIVVKIYRRCQSINTDDIYEQS
ncbi:MAG: hypothetical protein C0601_06425 [Candidatus Muiribacterium halophilum]|uniref:Cation:proton antiporter n=1 Tax=Muiribacterium halophilum TaxID=2053465 RepID=A0A2N5ZG22_MUIH1|nr:MAG: hypothetical protein C0601_06425 [Candidatus Muirbacterium halophilum]